MRQAVRTFYLPEEEDLLNRLLDDARIDVLKKQIKAVKDAGIRVWVHIIEAPLPNPGYLNLTRRIFTFVMRQGEFQLNELLNSPDLVNGDVTFHTLREGSGADLIETDYAVLDCELYRSSPLLQREIEYERG